MVLVIILDLEFMHRTRRHRWILTSLDVNKFLLLGLSVGKQLKDARLRIEIFRLELSTVQALLCARILTFCLRHKGSRWMAGPSWPEIARSLILTDLNGLRGILGRLEFPHRSFCPLIVLDVYATRASFLCEDVPDFVWVLKFLAWHRRESTNMHLTVKRPSRRLKRHLLRLR